MDEQHGAPRAGGAAAEVIDQPEPLLRKVGVVAEDAPDPIAMADRAVAEQRKFYLDRSRDDLASLRAAFARAMADCAERSDALRSMFALAHDMRGQGGSFGYHMVTDIAGSLCDLLRDRTDLADARMSVSGVKSCSSAAIAACMADSLQGCPTSAASALAARFGVPAIPP